MLIVGIAGGSGSGKTTFSQKVVKRIQNDGLAILSMDSYYHAEPPAHLRQEGKSNFDHPDAFDWPLLHMHLSQVKEGAAIDVPVYDFTQSRRSTYDTVPLGPCRAILLEGIFALWSEEIRSVLDLKIFLEVDADIRFIRRLHRDVKDRGRTIDGIIGQYYDTVRPMHREYLEPTRRYADLIVGEESDLAADVLASRIRELLH